MHAFSRAAYIVQNNKILFVSVPQKNRDILREYITVSPGKYPVYAVCQDRLYLPKAFHAFLLQSGVFPVVLHCSGVPDGRIFCSVIVFTWRKRDPRVLCLRVDRVLICLVDLNR